MVIHRDRRKPDRARKGASGTFWSRSRKDLVTMMSFELIGNIRVSAAVERKHRVRCILVGGSFSTQIADLHSAWGVYEGKHRFRGPGELV